MQDLIRSPLQFVRPMSDPEWQDLVARGNARAKRKAERRRSPRKMVVASSPRKPIGSIASPPL